MTDREKEVDEEVVDEIEEAIYEATDEEADEENDEENDKIDNESTDEGIIVTLGEEKEDSAPAWVKDLRSRNREMAKEIRALREAQPQQTSVLGERPTLSDMDYDEDKYAAAMDDWYAQKVDEDNKLKEAKRSEEEKVIEWNNTIERYGKHKEELNVNDYEDAEQSVTDGLSDSQQGIIVQGAKNPALVVYALGKNPKKMNELAKIKSDINFAFAIADMERELKTRKRSPSSKPEKLVTGTANSKSASIDKLRKEAEKTGDISKVLAFKREQRRKG